MNFDERDIFYRIVVPTVAVIFAIESIYLNTFTPDFLLSIGALIIGSIFYQSTFNQNPELINGFAPLRLADRVLRASLDSTVVLGLVAIGSGLLGILK